MYGNTENKLRPIFKRSMWEGRTKNQVIAGLKNYLSFWIAMGKVLTIGKYPKSPKFG